MNEIVIGKCSKCGGEIIQFVGTWMSVLPPPSPKCRKCNGQLKMPTIEIE